MQQVDVLQQGKIVTSCARVEGPQLLFARGNGTAKGESSLAGCVLVWGVGGWDA